MITLPLRLSAGHLFAHVEEQDWLLDTGAPLSFGDAPFSLGGQTHRPAHSYLGLDAAGLSRLVGEPVAGLLAMDVIGRFDLIIDVSGGRLTLADVPLDLSGTAIGLESAMGVPVLEARAAGSPVRLAFDTGAQLSYVPAAALAASPRTGRAEDFYPGMGRFETDVHDVRVELGPIVLQLRAGRLPDLLQGLLVMLRIDGVLGNEPLRPRPALLAMRRRLLVLGEPVATG